MTAERLLSVWLWVALPVSIVAMYLTVNKIWIRRHDAVVADSISVAAKFLALFSLTPYLLLYVQAGMVAGTIRNLLVIAADMMLVLIGVGLWVQDRRELGFWRNLKRALRLERREATMLLRDVFHPVAAQQLVEILHDFAAIDDNLDEREIRFIEHFARRWNIDLDAVLQSRADDVAQGGPAAFARLRERVGNYVAMSPPVEQARQLGEVLSMLTEVDEHVAESESAMLDELLGLIENYTGPAQRTGYYVLIVPQSPEQAEALAATQPDWPRERRLGGDVLRIGHYFSRSFAEMVCDWYRNSGYLTLAAPAESAAEPVMRRPPTLRPA